MIYVMSVYLGRAISASALGVVAYHAINKNEPNSRPEPTRLVELDNFSEGNFSSSCWKDLSFFRDPFNSSWFIHGAASHQNSFLDSSSCFRFAEVIPYKVADREEIYQIASLALSSLWI